MQFHFACLGCKNLIPSFTRPNANDQIVNIKKMGYAKSLYL